MSTCTTPMFPLGTVLFPHALLPLHVFEPRYRTMLRDVLAGDQEFGVVLIERGSEVGGGDVRFDVGTLAHIVQASELPDGRFALAVVGVQRFRVERWLPDDPYPRADIVRLEEPPVVDHGADRSELVEPVVAQLRVLNELSARLHGGAPVGEPSPPLKVSSDPEQASYEIAARAGLGSFDAQRVLELPDTATRLRALHELLADGEAVLRARLDEAGDP